MRVKQTWPFSSRAAVLPSVLFLLLCLPWTAGAEWSHDPAENNPVCTAAGDQTRPALSGTSEDNLSPGAPLNLTGAPSGDTAADGCTVTAHAP